jgi:hypothetical protein
VRRHELQNAQDALARAKLDVPSLSSRQQRDIRKLASQLDELWHHLDAPPKIRKQIIRAAIHEIIVTHLPEKQLLDVVIHWQGGSHSKIFVKKRATPVGSRTDESMVQLVQKLSACLDDPGIARVLNMKQTTTPRGLRWTMDRVRQFRHHHKIRLSVPPNDPDILNSAQVAEYLGVSRRALSSLVQRGIINPGQVTDFAPWAVHRSHLDSRPVQQAVSAIKNSKKGTQGGDGAENQGLLFSMISAKQEKEAL